MYTILKESHNGLGMLLLFILLASILFIVFSYLKRKPFLKSVRLAALIGLIVVHLQILVGIFLYTLSPLGMSSFTKDAMGHSISRFYLLEHPIGMIIAAILITIGYRASKKEGLSDRGKYNRVLVYYIMGFSLIAYLIPWFLWS